MLRESKTITITHQDYIQLKWDANYWKSQHGRACVREDVLKQELQLEKAKVRDLTQRLFGKKTEKGICKSDQGEDCQPESKQKKRARGQQKGQKGHGRTSRPDLHVVEETIELNETCCSTCGKDFSPFPGEETSEIHEIEVSAFIRKIRRKRAKKGCCCSSTPGIICAPVADRLIPKTPYGLSIWEHLLLSKYLYSQPIHRTLQQLSAQGLPISQGTVTGGLKKLNPLFKPVYQALYQQQMKETLFHNDESRWEVFEEVEGKVGHRWYLWVTQSKSVTYYVIDPTRSTDVPLRHFSELCSDKVFVVCDRYSAYKKLARLNSSIVLAYCWAHVRRDFIELARSIPALESWGFEWVEKIGLLYHLNKERLKKWDPSLTLAKQSQEFNVCQQALETALTEMISVCENLLLDDKKARALPSKGLKTLAVRQRKVLNSLKNHWAGLIVFLSHPIVPMDNNTAERAIRSPVTGRKNFYGSGSLWSSEQALMLYSIFQTMKLHHLNPHTWLHLYFECCASNKGQPPDDLSDFLPWKMSEERRQQLSKPLQHWNTS